jgi:hypothetical protein
MTSPIRPDQHDWKKGTLFIYECRKCGWSTAAQYQPSRNAKVQLKSGHFSCDEYLALGFWFDIIHMKTVRTARWGVIRVVEQPEKLVPKMSPARAAAALRTIASKIEASRRPDPALVASDVRRFLAEMTGQQAAPAYKPSKPSEMTNPHQAEYLLYSDTNSAELPLVVFVHDPYEGEMKIMSFGSQEEVDAWTGKQPDGEYGEAGTDPANAEPIDPADADELAASSGMQLIEWQRL